MKESTTTQCWTDANQRFLVAKLACIKTCLDAGSEDRSLNVAVEEARQAMDRPPALEVMSRILGLTTFEEDLLLLCAGVEMDAAIARRCGDVQGYPQRTYATFGVALAALPNAHWSALAPIGALRHWRLLDLDEAGGLANGRLRIDERILHYLAGINYLDPRIQSLVRPRPPASLMARAHRQLTERLLGSLLEDGVPQPVVLLSGDDLRGQGDVARAITSELALSLYLLAGEDIPAQPAEMDALAILWQREAALLKAGLLVECRDAEGQKKAARLAEQVQGLVFLAGRNHVPVARPTLRVKVDKPESGDQRNLWEEALGAEAGRLNGTLDSLSAQFRLSAETIQAVGQEIKSTLDEQDHPDTLIWEACRRACRSSLDELAQRIEPRAEWEDLIVPDAQKTTLQEMAAQFRHRLTVYHAWGFAEKGSRGLGISALFAGESGTGKTMAAEVLANELHLDLYRIDLSSVVSKYIGETEKNLQRVFDAAEDSGAILLFDEADALFGKRSEVKDSHDRYANIEVSYLLQRMEAYRGLAILTSNMKAALDPAFHRRIRFMVMFPFPDTVLREAMWRRIFPAATPRESLDYHKLARLHVTGGNIRNIALNASFLAANTQEPIRMCHLLQAAHREAAKRERPLSDAETRGWT